MKRLKNIIRLACIAGVGTLFTTSCQDWLTIYPQTQIVEENFWEDKTDLEGVRYAAYKNMCSTLQKMVLWGDLRSDSYELSVSDEETGTQNLYDEIRGGRIERDSAQTYFDWSGFYTTINYCNKVLYHGAEVLKRDKQFTQTEWRYMKAEITALRALNYFYLIRSFKDVPYTTKVINKDTEVEYFSATNQLVVLDSLIADVESVKGQARVCFTSLKDTKGLMTNPAIYALLSDMYLWRASLHEGRFGKDAMDTVFINNVENPALIEGIVNNGDSIYVPHTVKKDYELCAHYADQALAALHAQTTENNKGYGMALTKTHNYGLVNCDMYENDFLNFKEGGFIDLDAYNLIFSQGNSDESIFELQFSNSDSRANDVVTSQWGYGNKVHLAVNAGTINAIFTSGKKEQDSRVWFSAWSNVSNIGSTRYTTNLPGMYCFKWRDVTVTTPDDGTCEKVSISSTGDGDSYRNWIIYRMSDVMLQKAEAKAALAANENDANAMEARRIVNAIHRRWYCPDKNAQTKPGTSVTGADGAAYYTTGNANTIGNIPEPNPKKVEIAVLNERQLEFLGEGKRWFDMVRYAERHAGGAEGKGTDVRESTDQKHVNSGIDGVQAMITNLWKTHGFEESFCTSLQNHIKNRYGLYNLIYYMEIKASVDANGVQHLEQNPVWNKSLYD